MNFIHRIAELIRKAQEIATKHGYPNLLQPGLVKEMIVADLLGHEVSRDKHQPDAFDPEDRNRQFEYLTCFENGSFQLDRMFKSPVKKRHKSLTRITRNSMIYCAIFECAHPLTVLELWEIEPDTLLNETTRQLDASSNQISHISFSRRWVRENGVSVYSRES